MNLKRSFPGRGLVLLLVLAMLLSVSAANLTSAQGISNSERIKVFIGFTETPGPAEEALVRAFGGTINHTYNIIPSIAAELPQSALAGLQRNPRVTIIEPVIQAYLVDNFQEELNNTWGVKHIKAGAVHGEGQFGSEIKVAIIDTGIDYDHFDLVGNYKGGYDFTDKNSEPMDVHGHGTHVAGTVAALRNGKGVVGVAPEAQLYALKVFGDDGSASYADIVAAIDWAAEEDNGIQITNNSYGSTRDPGSQVKDAFDKSYDKGILHVAAAGNSGNIFGWGDNVIYPARYSSVIAVSASDSNNRRASFSSTGPDVELTAPGVSINSTVPDDKYALKSGTSMASPHVAGVAALVMAAGITDNAKVRQILQDTAEPLGNSNHFGHGLVRADLAVGKTAEVEPPASPEEYELNVSSTAGGSVTTPGEGTFTYEEGTVVDLEAVADNGYTFVEWTGDTGTIADVNAASTTITIEGDYSIIVNFAEVTGEGEVRVDSITYSTRGGRLNDRHLDITLLLLDDQNNPVANASVSATLNRNNGSSWDFQGTTGSNGTLTFSLNNHGSGCYETEVTAVEAQGLEWDGETPENGYCK